MKRLNLTFGLLCLGGTMLLPLQAQNTTNLPTSMYGIGELSPGEGGRLSGMGNVGIALNRLGFQNTLNPAAITRMDSTCFTFDVGVSAAYARYAYLSDRSSSMTANPNRFSLGFRLRRRWYPFRDSFVEGRNVRPHIPLGHRKASGSAKAHRHAAPAEQADGPARGVEGGEKSADGALYRIFDENDEPLVIDLEAIDRCQKLRAFTPFDVAQRDFEDEDAGRQEAV